MVIVTYSRWRDERTGLTFRAICLVHVVVREGENDMMPLVLSDMERARYVGKERLRRSEHGLKGLVSTEWVRSYG